MLQHWHCIEVKKNLDHKRGIKLIIQLHLATGFNFHLIVPLLVIVCISYTTIGGLKGVVWTDAVQCIIMLSSTLAIIVIGLIKIDGFGWLIFNSIDRRLFDVE